MGAEVRDWRTWSGGYSTEGTQHWRRVTDAEVLRDAAEILRKLGMQSPHREDIAGSEACAQDVEGWARFAESMARNEAAKKVGSDGR